MGGIDGHPGDRVGFLRALRWPTFRRVWVVSSSLQFGYWFSSISFQWLVARATNNDPLTLSLLYFCMLVPMLVLSLPAGVLADLRDRRRIILLAQLGVIALSAGTAALVVLDRAPVAVLLICGFGTGAVNSFAVPSSQALVATSVPTEDLRSAIVLSAAGMNLARLAGPAAAGLLILYWGAVESVLAYGVVAVFTIVALRRLRAMPSNRATTPGAGLVARIRSGVGHVRERAPASSALLIVASTSVFGLSYIAQMPAIAARVSPDPATFLVFITLGAAGSVIGVLIVALRSAAEPSVAPAAVMLVLLGLIVVGLAVTRVIWLAIPLVILGGAMQLGIMTHCSSVVQAVVDDDHRGRVMSLFVICWGGSLPIGGLLLGATWHYLGPVVALGASGTVAVLIATAVLWPRRAHAGATVRPVAAAADGTA